MDLRAAWDQFRENQARRKLAKLSRRLCEKWSQGYERVAAVDELNALPGDEPIFILLHRFGIQVPKISEDEEERQYIFDLVLAKGEAALPSIRRYIREKEDLAYPLQLLERIAGREETRRFLLSVLDELTPEYDRAPQKKMQILLALGSYQDEEVVERLLPFLKDPNDDVVLSAMDSLSRQAGPEPLLEKIRDAFLAVWTDEEEKPRLKRRLAELFKELRWKVTGFRAKVEEHLPDGFYIDKKGFVKKMGDE
jgi:hypothetical protein